MHTSKNTIFLILLCLTISPSFAMQKDRDKKGFATSISEQLFHLVRLAMWTSTAEEERQTYMAWKFIKEENYKVFVQTKPDTTLPLNIKSRNDVPLDYNNPNQYLPKVIHYETIRNHELPHIKYSVVGIQNHAIRCYIKSRSWFENHPFQFASLTAATGIGIGWLVKTWIYNHQ